MPPSFSPEIVVRPIESLRAYANNARTHSKRQISQIVRSIQRFGFTNPVLIADDGEIVAGHGRVAAAKQLGLAEVPTLALSHLTTEERRAYVLADNKLALNAGWDMETLSIELQGLIDIGFAIENTGFGLAEIDLVLDAGRERRTEPPEASHEDEVPASGATAVTRFGDLWELGRHRLLCGDARVASDYTVLLGDERVDLIFTDPPYNVKIDGHVTAQSAVRHREFAFASGEMDSASFTSFLAESLGAMAACCKDGTIAFVCMDWRHMRVVLDAGRHAFSELKNLCVWNKTNGGMGTFYRSKHELVFVFKVGNGPHVNSFGLGDTGRYRTNVWDYAGISSISATRNDDLAMHPTVKPVALIADAIRDCSRRGALVLDGFGGSGSTLIAAETCGRSGRLIEYDPIYCDTIVRRWQSVTGLRGLLRGTETSFEDIADQRLGNASENFHRLQVDPSLHKATKRKGTPKPSLRRSVG